MAKNQFLLRLKIQPKRVVAWVGRGVDLEAGGNSLDLARIPERLSAIASISKVSVDSGF